MATRDFKIRNGLDVGGDITYRGGTITVFDSETVLNIVNEAGNSDSDLTVVADLRNEVDALRTDADSDSTIIQQLRTDHDTLDSTVSGHTTDIQTINNILDSDEALLQAISARTDVLETRADSDDTKLQDAITRIETLESAPAFTDSDYKVVADLRNDVDSDTAVIQTLRTDLDALDTSLTARLDSDSAAIQSNNTAITSLQSDITRIDGILDSDEAAIQGLSERVEILETNADSDVVEIGHLRRDADSDASRIAKLREEADSDSAAIQALQTSFSSDISALQSRADSDETAIQSLSTSVSTINARLDSDTTAIQDLGTRIDNLGGSATINVSVFTFTAANNEDSDFSGTDDNGRTLSYVVDRIHVYLNGILLTSGTDYTATDGSTVTLVDAPDSDDIITIVKYLGTVQAGFDSDQVVAIITENTNPDIDSRLDSDEAALQALRTDIEGKIDDVNTDYSSQAVFTLDSFATGDFRSVKYFISADSNDSSYMATEVIVIHDGTNAYITEYGTVSTHDSEFITLDADIDSGNVRLRATPTNGAGNVKAIRQHINHT